MQRRKASEAPEQARHLTLRHYRNEDGRNLEIDNYVRSQSPYAFNLEEAKESGAGLLVHLCSGLESGQ